MTARLSVLLDSRCLESVDVDVLVVSFGETERPLRGPAARIDWRLCGRLSDLVRRGALSGRGGEAALLTGGGGVRAPLVLALGRGEGEVPDAAGARALAQAATARALGLGVESLALPLVAGADAAPAADRMGATVDGAAAALAQAAAGRALSLRVVAAPEDHRAAAEWMHRAPRRSMPEDVELHLPSAHGTTRPATPAGKSASRPLGPLVK